MKLHRLNMQLILRSRTMGLTCARVGVRTPLMRAYNPALVVLLSRKFATQTPNPTTNSQNSSSNSESIPVVKPEDKAVGKPVVTEPTKVNSTPPTSAPAATEPKKPLWERIKHEINHYKDGTKLLGYEIKVSTKLLFKMAAGYALSRRETNQLKRTLVDVARLVPFLMFVIVPFAELLLPIALKIFPNLLPSTYESTLDKNKKKARLYKTRQNMSSLLRQTMESKGGLKLSKKISTEEKELFVSFFQIISSGQTPTHAHLTKVARMFKNDQVLDNLTRSQLLAMAKYMAVNPFGTDSILRYQIRHRLLTIIKDDKAIDYEGVGLLTVPELYTACSQRGIKTSNVSPARMREDLTTWLDLRLRQKIPSTLLLLLSAYTYGEHSGIELYYDALLAVLSSIPDEVYNVAKLELEEDSKTKLSVLKDQDELIQEENLREKGTVTKIKDNINLDELEEATHEGMKIEEDDAGDTKTSGKKDGKEEDTKKLA